MFLDAYLPDYCVWAYDRVSEVFIALYLIICFEHGSCLAVPEVELDPEQPTVDECADGFEPHIGSLKGDSLELLHR